MKFMFTAGAFASGAFERFLAELEMYLMYIAFMAVLFTMVFVLSNKQHMYLIKIAAAVFVSNFGAAWWALQFATSYSIIFCVVFYATMGLAPAVLLLVMAISGTLPAIPNGEDIERPLLGGAAEIEPISHNRNRVAGNEGDNNSPEREPHGISGTPPAIQNDNDIESPLLGGAAEIEPISHNRNRDAGNEGDNNLLEREPPGISGTPPAIPNGDDIERRLLGGAAEIELISHDRNRDVGNEGGNNLPEREPPVQRGERIVRMAVNLSRTEVLFRKGYTQEEYT